MFVLRKEELKEDKNEAKKETEWRLILHKDSSSFYLTFIVFKWTPALLCIDIFNLFKSQGVVLACFFKQGRKRVLTKPAIQPLDLLSIP